MMAMRALLATAAALTGLVQGLADTDTITWGGDNSRCGYQTNHNLDPSVVGSSQFGQLFSKQLPGVYAGQPEQFFSQPLVYTPSGSTKQFVYFASTQNNLYKLDAKTGEIVLSRNLHIPFLTADLDGCVDINPAIGVTSTGVIDPDTDTLYLTAKTYIDQNGGDKPQGKPAGRYYAHAIDVNTLEERPNFPVNLEGLIATNNPERMFTGGIHHQRPGLLHVGNHIYAGFASHCVQYNFTGWIIGWDKTSGQFVEHWATEGLGIPSKTSGGGVWMSGGGLASDDKGSLFFGSGNGYASQQADQSINGYNPPTSLEEAAVHMTINDDGSLHVVDFFMPWEKRQLDGADKDLGTSPLELLPSQFSCGSVRRIGVITGKSGKTYFLNLDNLGGYKNGKDGYDDIIYVYQNLNSVYAGAGVYPLEGGYIYINVIGYPTVVFQFSCAAGVPTFSKVAETAESGAAILGVGHGTTTSLNGQEGTGLLWVTDVRGYNLRVYDAVPKGGTLNMIASFNIPDVNKFTRPVFGDGVMYLGNLRGIVYAFGSPVNTPLNCTSPVDFGKVNTKNSSASMPVTCKALIDVTVKDISLSDQKNKDFALSGIPTLPMQLASGQSFTVQAKFGPSIVGLETNDVLVNTTNSVDGYSTETHARLVGTGASADPLFRASPQILEFPKAITGQDAEGIDQSIVASNLGNRQLTVRSVLYSNSSTSGPFQTWSGQGDLIAGRFTISKIPSAIAPNTDASINVNFNTSTDGYDSQYLLFVTDGGNASVSMTASSGPPPKALLEFQTPDESGWVEYVPGKPFNFGNVTEYTYKYLKFRVTNAAPKGAGALYLTVSKPPFGIAGLVRALTQSDLAEGTAMNPGESANATLICNAPYAQWDTEPYNGTAQWTMNTNDPTFDKQYIEFFCKAVAEQAPPLLPNGQGQFKYAGCWKDNTPDRQLSNQLFGDDNLLIPQCIKACADQGYVFCGMQYHRECWGGNQIPTVLANDSDCNFGCAGNLKQMCGGNGDDGVGTYISLFGDSLKWDGNTTRPPVVGPFVNPGVDGFTSIGCYTEATDGRALSSGAQTDKKTVKNCVDACKANSYTYAGVEYGGECWCGNEFSAGAVPVPDTDCKMTCNDNSTEFCGGPSRLNVYKFGNANMTSLPTTSMPVTSMPGNSSIPPSTTTPVVSTSMAPSGPAIKDKVGDWKFQGCWTEATNSRTLDDKTYTDDAMSLESCAKFCDGFAYFGTEYGRECYCGDELQDGSGKAANQNDCSFPCGGDGSEYCGAGNRLQLYKYGLSSNTSAVSTASSTASDDGVDSVTSTSVSSPVFTSSAVVTPISPTASNSGLNSGTISSISGSSSLSSTLVSSSSSTSPTPTGPVVSEGNANFTYYSCVSEPSDGRLLGDQKLNAGNMTIELCLKTCYDYKWAGVEYGQECWCGNTLSLSGSAGATSGTNVSDSECSFLCPGNSTEYCGAGVRMSLYKHKELTKRIDWTIL